MTLKKLILPDLSRCNERKLRTQLAIKNSKIAKKTAKEKYEEKKKSLAAWEGWFK